MFGVISICFFLRIVYRLTWSLGAQVHIAVPGVIYTIRIVFQLCRQRLAYSSRRTDGSSHVVAAIDIVDDHIGQGVLTVDVHIGVTTDISHSGTAEHLIYISRAYAYVSTTVDIGVVTATIYVTTNLDLRYAK